MLWKPFIPSRACIILYGHKLNGNIKAIYEQWIKDYQEYGEIYFLTMDRDYAHHLKGKGINCLDATQLSSAKKLAQSRLVISTHGLHCLSLLLYTKAAKFVDVWHGIPFKGFDAEDFRVQHRFNEAWVSSEALRRLYIERFGFEETKVFSTGYARTDLVLKPEQKVISEIRLKLGLLGQEKIVLFAPTWKQDSKSRSLFPFDTAERTFLHELNETCKRNNTLALLRTHLNTKEHLEVEYSNVRTTSSAQFPDTEELLSLCDILICDWSSIAFDFLVLDRPTIFLDVPAPFKKGFSLPAEDRFGAIVHTLKELFSLVEEYLQHPDNYLSHHRKTITRIKEKVYDNNAYGKSATRCCDRARALLKSSGANSFD